MKTPLAVAMSLAKPCAEKGDVVTRAIGRESRASVKANPEWQLPFGKCLGQASPAAVVRTRPVFSASR